MSDAIAFMREVPVDRARGRKQRLAHRKTSLDGRSRESRQFWLIYAFTFPVFLLAALTMRIVRLSSRQALPRAGSAGLLREANELASASIPYAFMG